MVHEQTRPINSNEYAVLTHLIPIVARENNIPPHTITDELSTQFHAEQLQDLKARDWNAALKTIVMRHDTKQPMN